MQNEVDLRDIPTHEQDSLSTFHRDPGSEVSRPMNFFLKLAAMEEFGAAVAWNKVYLSICPEFHRLARECHRDIQAGGDPDDAISWLGALLYQAGIEAALRLPRSHFEDDMQGPA